MTPSHTILLKNDLQTGTELATNFACSLTYKENTQPLDTIQNHAHFFRCHFEWGKFQLP